MATATVKKIIAKHVEELGFLFKQRSAALRSPDWRLPDVKRLDDRIEAHLDGLRIAAGTGRAAVTAHLKDDEPWSIAAAGAALLQLHAADAANEVVDALVKAPPEQMDGLRGALLHGPIDLIEERLRAAADSAPPHVAAAALEALLYHGSRGVKTARLAEFVRHEDPAVRRAAWRAAALS